MAGGGEGIGDDVCALGRAVARVGDVRIGACIGVGGNNHLRRRRPEDVTLEHRQLGAKRVARLHGSNARRRVSLETSTRPFGWIRDAGARTSTVVRMDPRCGALASSSLDGRF